VIQYYYHYFVFHSLPSSDVSSISLIYVMFLSNDNSLGNYPVILLYRICIKETLGITDCHLSPLKGNKWTEPRCRLLVSKLFVSYTLVLDCSSFKTLRELGLDPCKRGRFISSIYPFPLFHYFCTQGSSSHSFMSLLHYSPNSLLIDVLKSLYHFFFWIFYSSTLSTFESFVFET